MNMHMRIPRRLYDATIDELLRPHPFALERVGFFVGRQGRAGTTTLMLLSGFASVEDSAYVDDPEVGARIGADAIRTALQLGLSNQAGVFHVHSHDHFGMPGFSRTDLANADEFIRPFRTLVPNQPHGMVVLSRDAAHALAWMPGEPKARAVREISIVGFPMAFVGREASNESRPR